MTIRLLIADDQQMFAEALKNLLETQQDIEVAACVTNYEDLTAALTEQTIHVALLDLYFGKRRILDDLGRLRKSAPATKWAILTGFAQVEDSVTALSLGCHGYIDKIYPAARVIDAVRRIHAGQIVTIISGKPSGAPEPQSQPAPKPEAPQLSAVQKKVLCLKARGYSVQKIAEACNRSDPWVFIELQRLRDLLNAPNNNALISIALQLGICEDFETSINN